MKPIKLTIEGINSFTDAQTLDFEAVGRNNLFCISGKTGAGKTTIFDSIMFALYGRSAKGNIADLVNLSRKNARVELEFCAEGDIYRVERTIKVRAEKNAEGVATDRRVPVTDCVLHKNGAPVAKGEGATELIRSLIGLEESEFKNVYLLEQGEYADFLKKQPAKQAEAVGKIFDLMRFGDVYKLAGEHMRRENDREETANRRIEDLGVSSDDGLKEVRSVLASLRSRRAVVDKDVRSRRDELAALEKTRDEFISAREKQKAVRSLMLQSDEAKRAAHESRTALEEFEKTVDPKKENRLAALRERLNELSALNSLDREYAAAVRTAEQKRAAHAEKDKKLAATAESYERTARAAVADADDYGAALALFRTRADKVKNKSVDLTAAIESLAEGAPAEKVTAAAYSLAAEQKNYNDLTAALARAQSGIAEKDEAIGRLVGMISTYNAGQEALLQSAAEAESKVAAAQKALSQAQLHSHAAAVRAELSDGDACPVCGGVYHGSVSGGDTDVDAAKRALEAAAVEQKGVKDSLNELAKHLDRAKAELDRTSAEKQELCNNKALLEGEIQSTGFEPDTYKSLMDALDSAARAGERARSSEKARQEREPELAAIRAEEKALKLAAADAAAKADELKARLGDACGRTESDIAAVKGDISALQAELSAVEQRRKSLASDVSAREAAVNAVEASLEKAKADCPVDLPAFDEEGYAAAREQFDRLNKSLAEIERDIAVKELEAKTLAESVEKLKLLTAERDTYKKRGDIYSAIADMTKGKAMLNYVAAEYIAEFTAIASDILSDLSSGKYTMSYDRVSGFVVSDYLNGGKSRKTDTLSGGELFLASLAVAIAIARTQSNGNNAFFFLDEGFGTLDDELIDTVYSALEALSVDCLVGVITHSAALIERMPCCVEVIEASDTKGSIIKY